MNQYKTFRKAYEKCDLERVVTDRRGIIFIPLPGEDRCLAKKPGEARWRERRPGHYPNPHFGPFRVISQRQPLWIQVRRLLSYECGIYSLRTTLGVSVELVHSGTALILNCRCKWGKFSYEVRFRSKRGYLRTAKKLVEQATGVWYQDAK